MTRHYREMTDHKAVEREREREREREMRDCNAVER